MNEYSDYVGSSNFGILMHTEGEAPEMVFSQHLGIKMLVDNRIYGTWTVDERSPALILNKDGTGTFFAPDGQEQKITYQFGSGNVFVIYYEDNTFDVIRMDFFPGSKDWAILTISSSNESGTQIVVERFLTSGNYTNTRYGD